VSFFAFPIFTPFTFSQHSLCFSVDSGIEPKDCIKIYLGTIMPLHMPLFFSDIRVILIVHIKLCSYRFFISCIAFSTRIKLSKGIRLFFYSFKQRGVLSSGEFRHWSCGFELLFRWWWENLRLRGIGGQIHLFWYDCIWLFFGLPCLMSLLIQITVWISSISFRAYAEIAFRSSSNVGAELFYTNGK
jgi:hypothetical protein